MAGTVKAEWPVAQVPVDPGISGLSIYWRRQQTRIDIGAEARFAALQKRARELKCALAIY